MSQKIENQKIQQLNRQLVIVRQKIIERRDSIKKDTPLWWTLNGQADILDDVLTWIDVKELLK